MNSARTDLSVVIITLNEVENLRDSLPPLCRVVQEIVVVDSFSTDGTVELCASYGATVVQREWTGYSDAKNFGNQVARNRWILSVDADEVLSDELVESIKKLDLNERYVYALDRITNYCGVWIRHSGWYPDWKIRIFDKTNVQWEGDFVHERLAIPTDMTTVRLAGHLYHYSYKTSEDHLRRMERYAELSAAELFAKRKHVSFLKRLLSPTFRFIRTYFLKRGFLDGREGLIISLRNARLVRLKYRKHKELEEVGSEKEYGGRREMKVLHISTARTWRGGEQQLAYLIEELGRSGVENWVFCPTDSAVDRYCTSKSIQHETWNKRSSFDFSAARKLRDLCKAEHIHVIHAHDSHAHTLLCLAASLFGNPVPAVVSRRVDFPVRGVLSRWKYNHRSVKRILCVSDEIRQIMTSAIEDASRLRVVYSGIDLEKFRFEATGKLRTEYHIPADRPIVANIAAIAPHKDYPTFVQVADQLIRDGSNALFLIIGDDGGEESRIRQMIAEKNLEDRILLTGFRNDIPEILPEIDLLLFTSKTEGLGTTILDAFAAGRPVVATAAGGIPEIVRNQETGLLAPVGDVNELAECVMRMLADDALRQSLSENARRLVQHFSKEETAAKTLEVYREVL